MDTCDAYVVRLIGEKEHAQRLAAAWCGLACGLVRLADLHGIPASLPPLSAEMPLPQLYECQARLGARLQPRQAAPANGTAPAVGVGA